MKWSVGYGLADKRSYGGSNTTCVSTQPSANAYLRSSRRYTVLRSKGTLVYGVYVFLLAACTAIWTYFLCFGSYLPHELLLSHAQSTYLIFCHEFALFVFFFFDCIFCILTVTRTGKEIYRIFFLDLSAKKSH